MSYFVVNTAITICWDVLPFGAGSPPVKADFDIHRTNPDESATYTDDGVTTFTAPTATARGQLTYTFTPTATGRYRFELAVGTNVANVVKAVREIYICDPPAHVFAANIKSVLGPEILPPDPVTPPGDPGTYDLEDLAYLDIRTVSSAELSGNTGNGILDGWYTTDYFLDSGVPDQAVPASWGDFQEFGTIRDAFEHATGINFRWGFLDAPAIAGEDNPYSLLENSDPVNRGSDYFGTNLRHYFPTAVSYGVNFSMTWANGLRDTSEGFFFSSEGGGGFIPAEYDVTANDNDRIGIGLVGTKLPTLSGNWTNENSNFASVGSNTFLYDVAVDGTNIYIAANQGEILRSTDGGTTFADCFNLAGTQTFTNITAGNGIIVAIDSSEVVYTSENSGNSWTNRGALPTTGSVNTLGYFDGSTKYFIVAGFLGSSYRMYRSTNGQTWTEFGTSITSDVKKAYPVFADTGSGLEVYLYYRASSITRLAPTDASETTYQTPPSATDLRVLHVENGLTVFRDEVNGVIGYNGTTEYTQALTWAIEPSTIQTYKAGSNIVIFDHNLLVYGTSAEWLTQDGITEGKMPTTYEDFPIGNRILQNGTDWTYLFSRKQALYTNSTGI